VPDPSGSERRRHPRSAQDERATSLIQALRRDVNQAAADLEADLRAGADASVIGALLSAAEVLASLRGIPLGREVRAVRRRLRKAGYDVA
jgi:hypothetical protein